MRTPAFFTAGALLLGLAAAPTQAAEPALVAPGAPFRVPATHTPAFETKPWGAQVKYPAERYTVTCSQGPTGTVLGQRVMLTASHCVNQLPGLPPPSADITVPVGETYSRIGTRGPNSGPTTQGVSPANLPTALTEADWAVVRIDDTVTATNLSHSRDAAGRSHGNPVKLTSIRDYRTLRPGEFSVDNFGQPLCKDGATTGRSCGRQIARGRDSIYSAGVQATMGDSGGVNFDPRDGAVVGTTTGGIGPLFVSQAADRTIEDAFGIPDGQVNEAFQLPETAPRADFTPSGVEHERIAAATRELNPDYVAPDPEAELRRAVDDAGNAAREVAHRAVRGEVGAEEVGGLVDKHANDIGLWVNLVMQDKYGIGG